MWSVRGFSSNGYGGKSENSETLMVNGSSCENLFRVSKTALVDVWITSSFEAEFNKYSVGTFHSSLMILLCM